MNEYLQFKIDEQTKKDLFSYCKENDIKASQFIRRLIKKEIYKGVNKNEK